MSCCAEFVSNAPFCVWRAIFGSISLYSLDFMGLTTSDSAGNTPLRSAPHKQVKLTFSPLSINRQLLVRFTLLKTLKMHHHRWKYKIFLSRYHILNCGKCVHTTGNRKSIAVAIANGLMLKVLRQIDKFKYTTRNKFHTIVPAC